jgi:hypothetical protein
MVSLELKSIENLILTFKVIYFDFSFEVPSSRSVSRFSRSCVYFYILLRNLMVVTRWLKLCPLDGAKEFVIGKINSTFVSERLKH